MILKDLDSFPSTTDARLQAGRSAEEQMAFYLKREFGRSESIFVFNGLRLEENDDVAQIDHLLLHKGGFVIVESKSVHGRICINEQGEWSRVYGSRQAGMPSPILQAKRQGEFLKDLLDDNAEKFGIKLFGKIQFQFGAVSIDSVIAISDSGIIDRPKNLSLPQLCKADQAPQRVRELLQLQSRELNPLNFRVASDRGRFLTASEIDKICQFFLTQHTPLLRGVLPPSPAPTVPQPEVQQPQNTPLMAPEQEVPVEAMSGAVCAHCGKPVSDAVQKYCQENSERFSGAIYCFMHQKRRKAA